MSLPFRKTLALCSFKVSRYIIRVHISMHFCETKSITSMMTHHVQDLPRVMLLNQGHSISASFHSGMIGNQPRAFWLSKGGSLGYILSRQMDPLITWVINMITSRATRVG